MKEVQKLDNKTLKKSFRNWFFFNLGCMNFQSLQAPGFIAGLIPLVRKLYPGDEKKQAQILLKHKNFYNTEPQAGAVINGIVASLEEERAMRPEVNQDDIITSTKISLIGPVAGIGDSIFQGILVPLLLSIGMSLSMNGSILGVLFYTATFLPISIWFSYSVFRQGYLLGTNSIKYISSGNIKRITSAFNILGMVVIGGIAASYIRISTPLVIAQIPLQESIDGISPNILALFLVLICWGLLKWRYMTVVRLMLLLFTFSIVGAYLGFL